MGLPQGKQKAAIQAADAKAEAELLMAVDTTAGRAPMTQDNLLLTEHEAHPPVNPADVSLLH